MTRFGKRVLTDLRSGRESWRVYLALCGPAFVIALGVTLLRLK
jgi:hypothetical protein